MKKQWLSWSRKPVRSDTVTKPDSWYERIFRCDDCPRAEKLKGEKPKPPPGWKSNNGRVTCPQHSVGG